MGYVPHAFCEGPGYGVYFFVYEGLKRYFTERRGDWSLDVTMSERAIAACTSGMYDVCINVCMLSFGCIYACMCVCMYVLVLPFLFRLSICVLVSYKKIAKHRNTTHITRT